MGQTRHWTEKENQILIERRKMQIPFKKIAEELGRSDKAAYLHFSKLKKSFKQKPKVKHLRKTKRGRVVEMIASQNQEAARSRPMLAIVGDRSEVAQTIRELFS